MMAVGICVFGCEVHGLVGEAGGGMERGWRAKKTTKGEKKGRGEVWKGKGRGETGWGKENGRGRRGVLRNYKNNENIWENGFGHLGTKYRRNLRTALSRKERIVRYLG